MAMDVCREVEPPEVVFPDGVRVACHLYPAGRDGGVGVASSQPIVAATQPEVVTASAPAPATPPAPPPASPPA